MSISVDFLRLRNEHPKAHTLLADFQTLNASLPARPDAQAVDAAPARFRLDDASAKLVEDVLTRVSRAREVQGSRLVACDSAYRSAARALDPFLSTPLFEYDPKRERPETWTLIACAVTDDAGAPGAGADQRQYLCSCAFHHPLYRAFFFYNAAARRVAVLGETCALRLGLGGAGARARLQTMKRAFRRCRGAACQRFVPAVELEDAFRCRDCRRHDYAPARPGAYRCCRACLRMVRGAKPCGFCAPADVEVSDVEIDE